jgi:hypothetical protein
MVAGAAGSRQLADQPEARRRSAPLTRMVRALMA